MFTLLAMPALSVNVLCPLLLNDQWTSLARTFIYW